MQASGSRTCLSGQTADSRRFRRLHPFHWSDPDCPRIDQVLGGIVEASGTVGRRAPSRRLQRAPGRCLVSTPHYCRAHAAARRPARASTSLCPRGSAVAFVMRLWRSIPGRDPPNWCDDYARYCLSWALRNARASPRSGSPTVKWSSCGGRSPRTRAPIP